MSVVTQIALEVGLENACRALEVSRTTYWRRQTGLARARTAYIPPRKLSADERDRVLATVNAERFQDQAPAQIVATLADERQYICSERTMYRILADNRQVRERRDQLRHPPYKAPELLATHPNQVWSWDITKLRAHATWTYFYLYVILDIYSRYVVGWMLADRENATLARRLFAETLSKHAIAPRQLIIHSDRGSPMVGRPLTELLSKLDLTSSHSRPHVSDDNPFSESHFKTMKYRPCFPERFGSYQDAHEHSREFFHWYNNQHRHSGIAYLTPADVHFGRAESVLAARHAALMQAYERHPERFVKGPPRLKTVPPAVWINPPKPIVPEVIAG